MAGRKDFLSMPAPENYVAGLGRGATGFTTRSDLGPAREGPSEEALKEALAKRAAQLGKEAPSAYGVTDQQRDEAAAEDEEERFADPDNEVGLFAHGLFDKEDDEADQIYQAVDERMAKRRKRAREEREKQEREEYEAKNPKISQLFADAKRALATVTDEEWASIPEVSDLTGRNKRARRERMQRSYAVPDSVLASTTAYGQMDTSISVDDQPNGAATTDGTATAMKTNFAEIGAARSKLLQVRLDEAEKQSTKDGTKTTTGFDRDQYLTSLKQEEVKSAEINFGEYNRTRQLLDSVTRTNPTHAPGWISYARLEERVGKLGAARSKILEGCEKCQRSEDVWIEAIRLHQEGNNHNAKVIAADAINHNPKSVRLWIAAMELETQLNQKKAVMRKAIDHLPKSVVLWKAAANLEEDPEHAKLLLAKATEFIPLSIELWLALARLESPEQARVVLNKARKAVGTSHEVWVAAARLEEQMGREDSVSKVIDRGVKSILKEHGMLKREEWIAEAEKAEVEGAPATCRAIIHHTINWKLDEDDTRKDVWMMEAQQSISRECFETARAIYAEACREFPFDRRMWEIAVELERVHGNKDAVYRVLRNAVEVRPKDDEFWLELAREKYDDYEAARATLKLAYDRNGSETIWLAAVDLEIHNKKYERARELLTEMRTIGSDRIWVRSVLLERELGNEDEALNMANQGLQKFPGSAKLWMQKGYIYEAKDMLPQAREAYTTGTRMAPKAVQLWLLAARIDMRERVWVKARSVLERGRKAVPGSEEIWLECVRLERLAGNMSAANSLMAQAQKECPNSGMLWAERILNLEDRTKKKQRALEAIKKLQNDKFLILTIARLFWAERKLDKAVNWFEKAIVADPDYGDTWAWYYKFLLQYGTDEKKDDVISKCTAADPKDGEIWAGVAPDPRNFGKNVEEILKMVVKELQ